MAKGKGIRINITLECTKCKSRNYPTTKSKRNTPAKLELRKYCPRCGTAMPHKETK
jgi:large subunit ribosomal protein L33